MTSEPGLQARLYRQRVPRLWWLRRPTYLLFILRELSSLFVAWFVAYLLLLVYAIGQGAAAYQRFLDLAAHPVIIAVNAVALAFLLLHAITFFQAAPQTTVIRLRGWRVPSLLLAAPIFGAWLVVSALLVWLVMLA